MLTIGIPVYNAEKYIESTLDSILCQTFTEFKIIISDNASTDKTSQICKGFTQKDSRIKYICHDLNLGAPRNWNYLVQNVKTKYFKWAAANDLLEKSMLEKCISALEKNSEVILCYPKTFLIDDVGRIEKFEDNLNIMDSNPIVRFRHLLTNLKLNNAQNGIIRSSALKKTLLEGLYIGGDIAFLAELTLYGKFIEYPEYLFYRRIAADASTLNKNKKALNAFYNPLKNNYDFQRSHYYSDLFKRACRSDLKINNKLSLYKYILKQIYWDKSQLK